MKKKFFKLLITVEFFNYFFMKGDNFSTQREGSAVYAGVCYKARAQHNFLILNSNGVFEKL